MISIDVIVYEQSELSDALENGYKHIALCDNCFYIPPVQGICYICIGDVKAYVGLPNKKLSEKNEIYFHGFKDENIIFTGKTKKHKKTAAKHISAKSIQKAATSIRSSGTSYSSIGGSGANAYIYHVGDKKVCVFGYGLDLV